MLHTVAVVFHSFLSHNTLNKRCYIPGVAERKPSGKLDPDNPHSSSTEPADQVQNQQDVDQYLALARELGADVVHIKDLYRHLDQVLKARSRASSQAQRGPPST